MGKDCVGYILLGLVSLGMPLCLITTALSWELQPGLVPGLGQCGWPIPNPSFLAGLSELATCPSGTSPC